MEKCYHVLRHEQNICDFTVKVSTSNKVTLLHLPFNKLANQYYHFRDIIIIPVIKFICENG